MEYRDIAREEIRDLPVYSPGLDTDEVKRRYGVEYVIKLASNENPVGPSPLAVEAIRRAAADVSRYPDGSCAGLRRRLSEKLGVEPERLLFGNGTDEIIDMIFLAFFGPGDAAVMGNPTFSSYFLSGMAVGARIVYVPLKDFGHHPEEMLNAVDDDTRALFVGTPHNPTGSICTRDEFERILEGLPERVLLVWDEAYFEYVDNPEYPASIPYLDRYPNLVVLRTFSKAYGLAGLRVGYSVADPQVTDILERVRPPFNVNRLAQEAALAALEDEGYLEEILEVNSLGKRYLARELDRLGMRPLPTQANFILFRYDHITGNLASKLLEKGIIVRDGAALGYPGYIRLTVGTPEDNRAVIGAIEHILG